MIGITAKKEVRPVTVLHWFFIFEACMGVLLGIVVHFTFKDVSKKK